MSRTKPRFKSRLSDSLVNKDELIAVIGKFRSEISSIAEYAEIGGPYFKAVDKIRNAIDDAAVVLTGNRYHFHSPDGPSFTSFAQED